MPNQGPIIITGFTPWTDETRPDRWGGSEERRRAARKARLERKPQPTAEPGAALGREGHLENR